VLDLGYSLNIEEIRSRFFLGLDVGYSLNHGSEVHCLEL